MNLNSTLAKHSFDKSKKSFSRTVRYGLLFLSSNRYTRQGYRRETPRYTSSCVKKYYSARKRSGPVKTVITEDLICNLVKSEMRGKAQRVQLQTSLEDVIFGNQGKIKETSARLRASVVQAIAFLLPGS
jgi:hypothetical protein